LVRHPFKEFIALDDRLEWL